MAVCHRHKYGKVYYIYLVSRCFMSDINTKHKRIY